ncbi:adenosine deaminase-like isoform X2 [Liolophura sinensis]
MCVYKRPGNFLEFLHTFGVFMPCVAGDPEAVWRMAYEFCEDCAKQKICYVEARYSPHILANDSPKPYYSPITGSFGARNVVETISDAFKKGSYDFGITAKSILCCLLDNPEWSLEVYQLCEEFRNQGVVAIDLASGEPSSNADANTSCHLEAFRKAHQTGIHRTMHAGEVGDSNSVDLAVNLFYAERIGHGYHVLDDLKLYRELCEKGIHFEVCPNSSVLTGACPEAATNLSLHPAKRFSDDDTNFSINSDDPLPCDTNLTKEFEFAKEMGISEDKLITCIFNAAEASFTSPVEKNSLIDKLEQVYGKQSTSCPYI